MYTYRVLLGVCGSFDIIMLVCGHVRRDQCRKMYAGFMHGEMLLDRVLKHSKETLYL